MPRRFPLICALVGLLACGDDDGAPAGALDASIEAAADGVGVGTPFFGRCDYTNAFAMSAECREYAGTWTREQAEADCAAVFLGASGELAEGPCATDMAVGRCIVGDTAADGYVTVSMGDASACSGARTGCEGFAGGTFEPSDVCGSSCEASGPIGEPFVQPFVECRDAIDGEPAGGTDGQVCTPTIISGSTEPGRRFADYADCSVVRRQRPYYAEAVEVENDPEDPRLGDESYMQELAWLREEAEASACICCHTTTETPEGAALWNTEAGDLWIDTLSNEALAMFAGFTDSGGFGFLPTEENNGFDRSQTGLPTTDRARLVAFMTRELERRGVSPEVAAELEPFAPFFRDLIEFVPEPCDDGLGIDEDGVLQWTGGGARYIYVLEADSASPGTPPNWDEPEGTLWLISVPPDAQAMSCGAAYGELPDGAVQRIPASGSAPALVSGETYYLHVQRDVVQPITRCTFVAP
ncbi:MAG: proteinase inhibitor [Myxococcota bacterium]